MAFSRVILMGDPSYFSIRRGANPHTRNRWGMKKWVDRGRAFAQWQDMVEVMRVHGVDVRVIPAHPEFSGLVFPANAGVVLDPENPHPLSERSYLLANLSPARAEEQKIYREFISALGIETLSIRAQFEGEADLIPWGDRWIFTYGRIERNRWVSQLGFPPWRRIYGFRSSQTALGEIKNILKNPQVMALELAQEAFYHGDTVLCSFGPERKYLLAYAGGLQEDSRKKLQDHLDVIWISDKDAWAFAANSFQIFFQGRFILFIPLGTSLHLRKQIESKGIETLTLDVSEFFEKGGGSVKCMIGDLGVAS
jgi:N-dimethylarginine dimethylaminohydrolase